MERDTLAWLALSRMGVIGGARCQKLIERFGSVRAALEAPAGEWEPVIGQKTARRAREAPVDWDWAGAQWRELQRRNGRLLTLEDGDYPALLRQIPSPPPALFVLGDPDFSQPCMALVGTRDSSEYGRAVARKLAGELVERGFCVVSGMARGIDTAAHQGALAGNGRTLAVLGCGADVIYPPENARLHAQIQERGAVLSEYPLGTAPDALTFPRRNRLISGLSLGTVVVEAPAQSGALITAGYALEQNREVFAVPGQVLGGRSAGCHQLLKEGAKLVEGVEDITQELEHLFPAAAQTALEFPPPPLVPALEPRQRQVFDLLGETPLHLDDLVERSGLPAAELLHLLLDLELEGLIAQMPGKRFARHTEERL